MKDFGDSNGPIKKKNTEIAIESKEFITNDISQLTIGSRYYPSPKIYLKGRLKFFVRIQETIIYRLLVRN